LFVQQFEIFFIAFQARGRKNLRQPSLELRNIGQVFLQLTTVGAK
jgi:hypothetical protein